VEGHKSLKNYFVAAKTTPLRNQRVSHWGYLPWLPSLTAVGADLRRFRVRPLRRARSMWRGQCCF